MKTKEHIKTYKHGYHLESKLFIPKGLAVKFLKDPLGGRWVLDEFPIKLFPPNSLIRHDAIHYGITINPENLENIKR